MMIVVPTIIVLKQFALLKSRHISHECVYEFFFKNLFVFRLVGDARISLFAVFP